MNKHGEWLAISQDDAWIDRPDFWSLAEQQNVHNLIYMVNLAHLQEEQNYEIHILSSSEDGTRPGAVIIESKISDNVGQERLKILADTLCRLIRPSRYESSSTKSPRDRTEVYRAVYTGVVATGHQRIASIDGIPRLARKMGRTPEGIQAALDELELWSHYPPGPVIIQEVA